MPGGIAGRGALASTGRTADEIFAALCTGRSGVDTPRAFDLTRYRTRHAFEIDDRPPGGGDVPMRATGWLLDAVGAALADADLAPDLGDVPVLIGTTLRELRSAELAWRHRTGFDSDRLHFGHALRERFGATNTFTVTNACAASLYVLGLGLDLIESGAAETVVVAGVDTISESTFGLLDRCYPAPPEALRPFDRHRQGMLQGEGAAAVVLRGTGHARHGLLRSVAVNCDAYHPSAPDVTGVAAAMREGQFRAGAKPSDVDLVFLHGTGTELNDRAEAQAMAEVFGDTAPLATAIKCMTGHTAGASGLHSLIAGTDCIRTGAVPAITTLQRPMDEAAGLRLVRDTVSGADIDLVQVHSFGFGGLNAVALLERGR
jgi:3-oxoacyl-[acyl-carrier-protein] synthase II